MSGNSPAGDQVDTVFQGDLYSIDDVLFTYQGAVSFNIDGLQGHKEAPDYSRLEFRIVAGKLDTWRSRFLDSRHIKNGSTSRNYAHYPNMLDFSSLFMPINTGSLADTKSIILIGEHAPLMIGDTPPIQMIDTESFIKDGANYERFYWRCDTPSGLTVAAGGSIEVPMQLIENGDDSNMNHTTIVHLKEHTGYAPHKQITMSENGSATAMVHAWGLVAGDQINIKLNSIHYSGIGRIIVDVI